ncbi:exported hypothetical protein [Xanthomonas citri pv. bilvae]|nr:exported hypothetical protein [Xanthomonas citri pv. bilvae]
MNRYLGCAALAALHRKVGANNMAERGLIACSEMTCLALQQPQLDCANAWVRELAWPARGALYVGTRRRAS